MHQVSYLSKQARPTCQLTVWTNKVLCFHMASCVLWGDVLQVILCGIALHVCKGILWVCTIWIACSVQCVISFTASELNCDGMRAVRNNSFHIHSCAANVCFFSRNGAENYPG